jgi:hypothetical protein
MRLSEDQIPLLIKLVGFWAERLPHDFRDDRMMYFIRVISRACGNNPSISIQVIKIYWKAKEEHESII